MSMQVSYKKQILFFLLILTIGWGSIEIITNVVVKSYVLDGCANRLFDSQVYSELSKNELIELCRDYYDTNVFISPERSEIIQFPSQFSNSVNINSVGLRGNEISIEKEQGIARILMLGGSTTFGWYATNDDSTIPALLEKKLNQNEIKYEVINAGHLNAGSLFETKLLKEMLIYEPNIIVVYDGYNDMVSPVFKNISSEEMDLRIFIKKLDSYTYSLRAIEKLIHEIETKSKNTVGELNSVTEGFTKEDYETRAELWAERWIEICRDYKSEDLKIYIFLQPFVGTGDRILTEYESKIFHFNAMKDAENYYLFKEQLEKINFECTRSIDLSSSFDEIETALFTDLVHVGDEGNKLIAEKIYQNIKEN